METTTEVLQTESLVITQSSQECKVEKIANGSDENAVNLDTTEQPRYFYF